MSGGEILRETIDLVPHYKESPLVQKAIADLEKILSEKKEKEVAMEAEKQQMKQPGKPSTAKDKAGMVASGEVDSPETHSSVPEGTGRKQFVLKALRERQAKLKSQEQKGSLVNSTLEKMERISDQEFSELDLEAYRQEPAEDE